jgi:hypothetical protein
LNRLTLTALTAGVGLLLAAAPARAVTLTATPANTLASGTYTVTIDPLGGGSYSVTVTGVNDGRLTADASGPEKHSVGRITIAFFRDDFSYIPLNEGASSGGTNSGGSFTGAPWVVAVDAEALRFNAQLETNDVGAFGQNTFTGVITLASPDTPVLVSAALQNGTQQWFVEERLLPGQGDLVPEPTSLALALPGLLPLALMWRRRRAA